MVQRCPGSLSTVTNMATDINLSQLHRKADRLRVFSEYKNGKIFNY